MLILSIFHFFALLRVCSTMFSPLYEKWNVEFECCTSNHSQFHQHFAYGVSFYTKCVVSYPSKSVDLPLFSDCHLHYWLSMYRNGLEWNGLKPNQIETFTCVCVCVCMCQITMYYKIMENDKKKLNHHWQWQSADDVSVKERSTFPIA